MRQGCGFLEWALADEHAARLAVPGCLIPRLGLRCAVRGPVPAAAAAAVTGTMWRCAGLDTGSSRHRFTSCRPGTGGALGRSASIHSIVGSGQMTPDR
jgi:hypothetical protein